MKHKRKIVKILCFAVFCAFAASIAVLPAYSVAQTSSGEGRGVVDKPDENQRQKALEVRQQNVIKLMNNQITRSQKLFEKMISIQSKIQSRISKMESLEMDTASLTPLMAKAEKEKAAVEASLDKVKEQYLEGNAGTDLKKAAKKFMVSVKELNKALISYHKALKAVVKEMKAIENKHQQENNAGNGDAAGEEGGN
jgi:hypothetical protein